MKIWVDADACPGAIKEILFRASARTGVELTLVANHQMQIPRSPLIRMIQVAAGFDAADREIVRRVAHGDLVISSDIPLAAEAIEQGALVLSPRGELLTKDNIGARLNMRDFLDSMRSSGIETGGPSALSQADRKAFADQLDRLLARAAGSS
ncbi:MAG: YaiI/YqxD family protein [Gammaproteobacteria bacterium]|nr:YaiI/YqxD family protein [Gammaproteobacteria bacterium]